MGFRGGSIIIPSINYFGREDDFWMTGYNHVPIG
jgi:hypothetical protein